MISWGWGGVGGLVQLMWVHYFWKWVGQIKVCCIRLWLQLMVWFFIVTKIRKDSEPLHGPKVMDWKSSLPWAISLEKPNTHSSPSAVGFWREPAELLIIPLSPPSPPYFPLHAYIHTHTEKGKKWGCPRWCYSLCALFRFPLWLSIEGNKQYWRYPCVVKVIICNCKGVLCPYKKEG